MAVSHAESDIRLYEPPEVHELPAAALEQPATTVEPSAVTLEQTVATSEPPVGSDTNSWFKCAECPEYWFSTKDSELLRRHLKLQHAVKEDWVPKHNCKFCAQRCTTRDYLQRHIKKVHPRLALLKKASLKDKNMVRWNCHKCPYFTRREADIKIHLKSHQVLAYMCKHCDVHCTRKHLLERHMTNKHAFKVASERGLIFTGGALFTLGCGLMKSNAKQLLKEYPSLLVMRDRCLKPIGEL